MADQVKNVLIPSHRKLDEKEVSIVLDKYDLDSVFKLPKIKFKDSALVDLEIELGNVVEIGRSSFAGKSKYYRVVVE